MRSLRHGCRSAGSARRPLRRKRHLRLTDCVTWSERVLASYVRPLRHDLVIKFKVAMAFIVNSLHRIAQSQNCVAKYVYSA